jgi:rod shape-determining protein MreD
VNARAAGGETATRSLPSGGELARLGALLLAALLLQTTVAPNIRILGASPDFALIIVVSVALLRGAEAGAVFGFLTGVLVGLALLEPLGMSALVFVVVGYFAGRYAETADLSAPVAPLVGVFAATLLANLLFAMLQYLLERQVPLAFWAGRVLLPSLVLNTLLAAPIYLLVRVVLGGRGVLRADQTA